MNKFFEWKSETGRKYKFDNDAGKGYIKRRYHDANHSVRQEWKLIPKPMGINNIRNIVYFRQDRGGFHKYSGSSFMNYVERELFPDVEPNGSRRDNVDPDGSRSENIIFPSIIVLSLLLYIW